MAVYDQNNRRVRTGNRIRNGLSDRTEGASMLLIVAALIAAALIGLWFYVNRTGDSGGARTSPPVTSSPGTATDTTPNSTRAPKQP